MNELQYYNELSKCVKCGACKALCPTYLSALDETMGARGRIAMLGALAENRLVPTKVLSDRIFSCILCGACRDLCPTGINIPEAIYHGRVNLRDFYNKGRLLRTAIKLSYFKMDTAFSILRGLQRVSYPLLYKIGNIRYMPYIASTPFKNTAQVHKGTKKIGRVAVFAGCSVNYFYPHLGDALLNILLTKGYEVVVLKGEVCCGAPMRTLGLEEEAAKLAKTNIELFNKMRTEAILCMCPTCTLVIRNQYPELVGDSIEKIMDVNEFFIKKDFISGLKILRRVTTYHDPCHLRYGLAIKDEPREILKGIQGIEFIEMQNAEECCGFGGFFSLNFKELSKTIGKRKIDSISSTQADTIVTSCPGCMMQLEDLKRDVFNGVNIMHIVEVLDEAMGR
jgi:glycolate oxidase iron-sulfur subunit